jgi:hypothetical protein
MFFNRDATDTEQSESDTSVPPITRMSFPTNHILNPWDSRDQITVNKALFLPASATSATSIASNAKDIKTSVTYDGLYGSPFATAEENNRHWHSGSLC